MRINGPNFFLLGHAPDPGQGPAGGGHAQDPGPDVHVPGKARGSNLEIKDVFLKLPCAVRAYNLFFGIGKGWDVVLSFDALLFCKESKIFPCLSLSYKLQGLGVD